MLRKLFVLIVVGFIVLGATTAWAHEHRDVGPVSLVVGWLNEPTYSGYVNAVQVEASKHGGGAITDAKLNVVVAFGKKDSTEKTGALTLNGSDEVPGEYTAPFIPTRPGTYTFHVTGDAGGSKIDQYFTSSETTFDDAKDPTADEFPAKDPTTGQLAQRLDGADSKTKSLETRALIAIVLGALGLLVGIIALVRRGS